MGAAVPGTGSLLLVAGAAAAIGGADPSHRAVHVADGVITWIGPDPCVAPPADRVVDIGGGWLTPGFVDAHVHATATGLQLAGLDLSGVRSVAECLDLVRAAGRGGGVVQGAGWDDHAWPEGRPPTAEELAAAAPGATVVLVRVDGHSSVADTTTVAALDLPALGADVVRGPDGRPTGWLKEGASAAALALMRSRLTAGDLRRAREAACAHALSRGITAMHEMGIPALSDLADARAWATERWPLEVEVYWADPDADPRGPLRPGGDLFLDGSIGSCTAATSRPYQDGTGGTTTGELFLDDDAVVALFTAATQAGVGAGVHAIGDRATAQAARALRATASRCGVPAVRRARHRIEHVEMVSRTDLATFADLGVVASVQPAFDAAWNGPGGLYEIRFGRALADTTNPLSWMAEAGVAMCFSSDSTVTPMDPWGGILAAVRHHGGLSIDRSTALRAATVGGHAAIRREAEVGAIRPGQRADIVVWPGDPLTDPEPAGWTPLAVMAAGALHT